MASSGEISTEEVCVVFVFSSGGFRLNKGLQGQAAAILAGGGSSRELRQAPRTIGHAGVIGRRGWPEQPCRVQSGFFQKVIQRFLSRAYPELLCVHFNRARARSCFRRQVP